MRIGAVRDVKRDFNMLNTAFSALKTGFSGSKRGFRCLFSGTKSCKKDKSRQNGSFSLPILAKPLSKQNKMKQNRYFSSTGLYGLHNFEYICNSNLFM